jgi:hypothetical protein
VSLDDHIRVAIERTLTDVRVPLDGALRALAQAIATEVRSSDRRLPDAMRSFDEAASLGDVLRVLADCVWREVDRSALLLVTPGRLRGWNCSGFSGTAADATTIDLPLDESGLLGSAVGAKAVIVSLASGQRTPASDLPPFAQGEEPRDAAAIPLVLGGTVAAVVYADEPAIGAEDAGAREVAPAAWVGAVELLTRYAALLLEARTARYLTGASLECPGEEISGVDRQTSGSVR